MTTSEFRAQFFALAQGAQRIVITSHMSPDDDSIGSVLSMRRILLQQYPQKDIRILYTGTMVSRYRVFDDFEKIEWVDDVGNHLEGVDMLVMVDASGYARFSKSPQNLQQVPITVAIDHHASEPDDFTLLYKDETCSSNTQLIYSIFIAESDYDASMASYLLLGILGDTGNFAYVQPSRTEVFVLAKALVEKVGMPIDQFRSRYGGIPKRIIPLLQELVKNIRYETIETWPPAQYTYIDRAVLVAGDYTDEDMSAASHIYMGQYLPRVEGFGWGFVITPRSDGGCRMSSRSLPTSVNVRMLHEGLGNGSGHDRASGGFFAEPDPRACIEAVLGWMRAHPATIG